MRLEERKWKMLQLWVSIWAYRRPEKLFVSEDEEVRDDGEIAMMEGVNDDGK